jgi:tetratricopeptide (TPR) repeat protein
MGKHQKRRRPPRNGPPTRTVGPTAQASARQLTRSPRDWLFALALVVVVFAAYRPAWNGQPVWDDDGHMTKPQLRSAAGLARIWTEVGATQQYYPLVHSVFWLEHRLFGDSTAGYHALNLVLHAAAALLLVAILRKLGIPGAWLAGWIFALHPVMVESAAWITELKNTLSAVFVLGAALAYLTFERGRERKHYVLALVLFVCGLLSKTVVAMLPGALLVVSWWARGRFEWKRDVVPLLPFVVLGAGAGLLTAWVERTFIGASGSEFSLGPIERFLVAGRAIWFYLFKLLWPANLIFIYPRWNIDSGAAWQYLFPLAVLLAAALLFRWRSHSRAPLATLLYFAVTLFPALGFFNVYPFRYSFVADHFQYLASIGPITAAAAGLTVGGRLVRERFRRAAQIAVPGLLLPVLFLLSWNQSGMYADAATLYQTTIDRNPGCWMAHYNLGILHAASGRLEKARAHYLETLKLKPDHAKAHINLGVVLAKLSGATEALDHARQALAINPDSADAHYNLGFLLGSLGRTEEARTHYLNALKLDPGHASAHHNLGLLLADKGEADEAATHYRKALDLNPADHEVHKNLGVLMLQQGRTDEALDHFRKAIEVNPHYAQGHNDLGTLLAQMGRLDEATLHFRRAVELAPADVDMRRNLALALARTGRHAEALSILQDAIATARSAGDQPRAAAFAEILTRLQTR